ncbi:MAG: SEC-C metal-binding domain-containing protein [Gammaproteobacteria bacterium]
MFKIGRNDPCPCGSGRKYKHCCLAADERRQRERGACERAMHRALDWLHQHHRDAMTDALHNGFFGSLSDEDLHALDALPDDYRDMVQFNLSDWLLFDATIETGAGGRRAIDLVLGPGGPRLTPAQHDYLSECAGRRIRAYEVLETRPGEAILIKDMLEPASEPTWVRERHGSRSLVQWDVLGARVIRAGGHWELSGAVYPIPRQEAAGLIADIEEMVRAESTKGDPALAAEIVTECIVDQWLADLVSPPPMPDIVDQASGEPVVLITDHYEVRDWDRLTAALARESDVEGDRDNGWRRYLEQDGLPPHSRAAINPGKGKRVEVFYRTQHAADDGRSWFEALAGDAVRHRTREIVDPTGPAVTRPARGEPAPRIDLPPEEMTAVLQQVTERTYARWSDEPIPALDGLTPRQAIATEAGARKVADLIKLYEHGAARQARDEDRPPVDYTFLWRQIGLDRRRFLPGSE